MANYPIGITVRNNRYSDYKWIKHSIGNKQSLINDQVNAVMEDEEATYGMPPTTASAFIIVKQTNGILFSVPSILQATVKTTPLSHYARLSLVSSGPEVTVQASIR